MAPTLNLAALLGVTLDFRPSSRADLEQYFLAIAPAALSENPTISEGSVDALLALELGGSTLSLGANLARVIEFTPAQREYLFTHERRSAVWCAFLEHQAVDADELTRLTGLPLASEVYTHLAEQPTRYGLSHLACARTILDRASVGSQVNYLSHAPASDFVDLLNEWGDDWTDYEADADSFDALIERRPEMIATLLDTGLVSLGRACARSRHLTDATLQLRCVGLPVHGACDANAWLEDFGRTVLSLANNPRCHVEVLSALHAHLESFAEAELTEDNLRQLKAALRTTTRCLAASAERGVIVGPYENVSDPLALAWLVKRCSKVATTRQRWYDVVALRKNRHLEREQRELLSSVYAPREIARLAVLFEDSLEPGFSAAQRQARVVPALVGPVYEQRVNYTVSDFYGELSRTHYPENVRRANEWLVRRLGVDPQTWSTFFTLATDWNGTLPELVETSTTLSERCLTSTR